MSFFPKISRKKMKEELDKIQAKPIKDLKANYFKYFKAGQMVFFRYNAKNKKVPFDKNPMIIVLRQGSKYTLGLNFHWTPIKYRKILIDYIFRINKHNIKNGKPIKVTYSDIKKIIKGFGPVIRLYINSRMSKSGAIIEPYLFKKAIELKTEYFIGISSDEAWEFAKKQYKKAKAKKSKLRKIRRRKK